MKAARPVIDLMANLNMNSFLKQPARLKQIWRRREMRVPPTILPLRQRDSAANENFFENSMKHFADSFHSSSDAQQRFDGDDVDTPLYERIRTTHQDSLISEVERQLSTHRLTSYELECAMVLLQYLDDNGF